MSRTIRTLLSSAFVVSMLSAAPVLSAARAEAEPGSDLKTIYVVDMQKVIDQSIVGKAARSDLQEELKKREAKLAQRRSEIEKMNADLQKQASLLAESALAEKRDAIRKKERDLGQAFEADRNEMTRKTEAQMKLILSQIDSVLAEFMKENENSIVVEHDPRLVVYSDPKYDVTAEIVKLLNEKKMKL